MRRGRLVQAVALGAVGSLVWTGVAFADTFSPDVDTLVGGPNGQAINVTLAAGTSETEHVGAFVDLTGDLDHGHHASFGVGVTVSLDDTEGILSDLSSTSGTITAYGEANEVAVTVKVNAPSDGLDCGVDNLFTTSKVVFAQTDANVNPASVSVKINLTVPGPDCPNETQNAAPTVHAGGPYSGDEGSAIALDAATYADTDGPATPATTVWTIDASSVSPGTCSLAADASLTAATITCTDNGTATVKVTVTDDLGASASDTASVTIGNVAPSVDTPIVTKTGACTASASAAFSDAGTADTHTGTLDWGDGTTPLTAASITETDGAGTASSPAAHTFTVTSSTVTVAVTDDDGDTGSNSASFTGSNVPSNFLAPINSGAGVQRSIFKLGSTIPVKITVKDCSGAVVSTLTPSVQLQKVDSIPDGAPNEVLQVSETPTNGKAMRWDGTQYIYNLSTKNSQFASPVGALSKGSYRLWVTDPSFFGTGPTVYFDLA